MNKFDAVSVNIDTMHDYDKDLKRFLSYNPYHNLLTSKRLNLNFSEDYIKNFDREIIETDRSGWRGYDKIYSKHISHLKNKKINLLEIGIQYGYGLLAWARYFNKGLIEGLEYSTEYVDDYLIIKEKFKESKYWFNSSGVPTAKNRSLKLPPFVDLTSPDLSDSFKFWENEVVKSSISSSSKSFW